MELQYFKTTGEDFYVPENDFMNVIFISKEYIGTMACDDSPIEGIYKELKISKKDYNAMREAALDKNRINLTGLLKKIHTENEKILSSPMAKIKKIENFNACHVDYNQLHKEYDRRLPILE